MKDIKQIISGIDNIIGGWKDAELVSSIERDIVLARIREMYEKVMVCGISPVVATVADKQESTVHDTIAPPQPEICLGKSIDLDEITKVMPSINEETTGDDIVDEPIFESPIEGFLDEKPEEDNSAEVAVKPIKMDRDILMSLYCEQSTLDLHTGIKEESSVGITLEKPSELPDSCIASELANHSESEPIAISNKILADILGDDRSDVASKIVSQQTHDLRKAIGVNDRFLLIRDLFQSDAMSYDSTINKLEEFNDLNQAMLFIYENYDWDPNNDAVKLLVELLTRKLS